MTANRHEVSFQGNENVLKWIVLMVTQFCKPTKNHRIVYFKQVNCKGYVGG